MALQTKIKGNTGNRISQYLYGDDGTGRRFIRTETHHIRDYPQNHPLVIFFDRRSHVFQVDSGDDENCDAKRKEKHGRVIFFRPAMQLAVHLEGQQHKQSRQRLPTINLMLIAEMSVKYPCHVSSLLYMRFQRKTRPEFLPAAFCILGSSNFGTVAVRKDLSSRPCRPCRPCRRRDRHRRVMACLFPACR